MNKLIKRMCFYLVITIMFLSVFGIKAYADEIEECKDYDIVVAIDVSGSMKQSDADRVAFETIELVLKLCNDNDRFGIVAFNDTIVYNSGFIYAGDDLAKNHLLEQLEQLPYAGETDNGLGMKEAVSLLSDDTREDTEKLLIYLADGVTDLTKSKSGRTLQDSVADMEWSTGRAVESNIPVYTFGFTNNFGEDMNELTAISAKTGGTYNACAGPLQMMNMVSNVFIKNKAGTMLPQDTMNVGEELASSTLSVDEEKDIVILIQTSQELTDFKTLINKNEYAYENTEHCQIIKINDSVKEDISFAYKGVQNTTGILTIAQWKHPEPVIEVKPDPNIKPIPKLEPKPEPEIVEKTFWEEYQVQITIGIIVAIAIFTLLISAVIIYAFFGKKKAKKIETELRGFLHTSFIDLKSRNDIPGMTWNLSDYPQEGVTLKELFEGAGIKEDLPELDRICLYPSVPHEVLLVHCTGGGIFINDRNVSANVPAKVKSGETIYVSFPENASEFSMRYEALEKDKKEEL